ncbi:MAG TPA: hypothetical protein VHG53_06385 [Candidatus Limnocylindria bacterium]|nr:hypothetical protein [Candidatus Limnocylindria bacterium]
MRRRVMLVLVAIAIVLAWRPFIQPAGRGAVVLLDLFSGLIGVDLAGLVSPMPREVETRETFAGTEMRISWWRPGWGDGHPAMMVVNGATPLGNDNTATRQLGRALARGGFLVMLPEFPFLKAGTFEPGAARELDAAFAYMRSLPETAGHPAGAFGSSVGGGALLAAAGREPALRSADHLIVLGAYFDLDTYLASVAARAQPRGGAVVPWEASDEVRTRLPPAALDAMPGDDARTLLQAALDAGAYDAVLGRLRALPPSARAVIDALSPARVWATVAPPVFWIHDPDDAYEPLAEAEQAEVATRVGAFRLVVPRIVQHAEVSPEARRRGPLAAAGELLGLLGFAIEVMRRAG